MRVLLLLLALMLAAPAASTSDPAPAAAPPAGPAEPTAAPATPAEPTIFERPSDVYPAVGTEPFWSLAIGRGRLDFELNQTEIVYSAPAPAPERTRDGIIYRTPRLVAEIRRERCSDGMSDNLYSDTVVVRIDGRRFDGCGGHLVAPDTLADATWGITAVDGRSIEAEDINGNFRIDFEGRHARIHGPCITYEGDWSENGGLVSMRLSEYRPEGRSLSDEEVADLVASWEGCTPARRADQARLIQILGGPMRVRFNLDHTAVLAGESGSVTLSW